MGRKLDLSGLTDSEAEHVLQVVQRDMRLRKKEEFRLSELKQELDEEGSRCLLLSRQSCFNQRCCIRCCSPFTFLLNPKRQCRDCHYNVCKACRVYSKRDKAWLCSACQKSRLLKAQSLEWFYADVKKRFKRFGSAKVLKTLYRKHLAEHGALSELTEGSAYEESICNEGSVCGSDSTFYRQTEEHSMAETLAVALRVAEEAVDEAISKAELDTASQEKQNEALYLREHRGELIEELAKTIVQKIISRRKTLADMRAEYDQDWPLEHNTDLKHRHRQSACDPACRGQPGLWRSQSAFSLLDSDPAGLVQDSPQALHKEGGGSAMSTWKSVDRLDNAVLKSPDGNWIALQSAQLSRPSLLTKRKSLVYSALERESGVVSAYEGMGSDNDTKPEPDSSWGAALQEIHRKMTDSDFNPPTGRRGSRDDLFSHSEPNKPLLALLKRQVPAGIRRPSSSPRTSIIDVNFNVEGAGDEEQSEVAAEPAGGQVRRSQKKRKSRKQSPVMHSNKDHHHPQHSSDAVTPEPFDPESDVTGLSGANQMDQELTSKLQQPAGRVSDSSTGGGGGGGGGVDGVRDAGNNGQMEERRWGREDGGEEDERLWRMEIDLDEGGTEEEEDEEMNCRLHRFVAQSRLASFSSTDDELDRVGQSEAEAGEDGGQQEENKETTDGLTYKLCQLEKEVRASQFSSTEDELDRAGVVDEEQDTGELEEEEEEEEDGDLAVKVSRLANQVSATQFSSTEDELDRAGRGEDEEEEEEAIDEETLWKLQAEKAVQAAQLRDLTSLVGASQFPYTEDHLDGAGEDDGATEPEVNEGGSESRLWEEAQGKTRERRESLGDLDVKMFDLRDESEDGKKESAVSDGQTKDVQHDKVGEKKDCMEQEERMVKGHECEVLKERTEEIIALHETNSQQENQPETQWPSEKEGEERQVESQGTWETAAEDSDEEDKEFDRIISSMLMLTLEDMQGETLKDEAAENDASEKERGDAAELQEKDTDPQDKINLAKEKPAVVTTEETLETNESERTCQRPEEDRRGSVRTEGQMTEAQGDCESKRTDEDEEQSSASSLQERLLSPEEIHIGSDMELYKTIRFISTLLEQRYSAVSLCSITTEVLKVLNATEELLQGVEGGGDPRPSSTSLPSDADPKKLDQQFSRLEENVYVAAGAVYTLEAELSDLEECARDVCSATSDVELSFLEEQVASAAAKVQQTELQICDISARIAALKSAGLNVDTQSRLTKTRAVPLTPVTLDSSRQQRRRLPAPPVTEDKES